MPPSHIDKCPNGTPTGNLLDGFSISRVQTQEWTGFVKILRLHQMMTGMTCQKYHDTVSDHFPVVARFRVSKPDDD
jgi:hypothetical protein